MLPLARPAARGRLRQDVDRRALPWRKRRTFRPRCRASPRCRTRLRLAPARAGRAHRAARPSGRRRRGAAAAQAAGGGGGERGGVLASGGDDAALACRAHPEKSVGATSDARAEDDRPPLRRHRPGTPSPAFAARCCWCMARTTRWCRSTRPCRSTRCGDMPVELMTPSGDNEILVDLEHPSGLLVGSSGGARAGAVRGNSGTRV